MQGLLPTVVVMLAILAVFFLLGLAGFRMKSNVDVPEYEKDDLVVEEPLDKLLPEAVTGYFADNVGDPVLLPSSVVAWGLGGMLANNMPLVGKLWLPLAWKAYIVPGETMNFKLNVTWYKRTFMAGGDSYLDGRGRYKMGDRMVVSDHVNRSEQVLMWLLSFFLAPSAVLGRAGVTWEEKKDEDEIKVTILSNEGQPLKFDLKFDREASELNVIETKRPTAKTGNWLEYSVAFTDYEQTDENVFLPKTMVASWEGEEYLRLEALGVHYNVTVGEDMQPEPIPETEVEQKVEELPEETESDADEAVYSDEELDEYNSDWSEEDKSASDFKDDAKDSKS